MAETGLSRGVVRRIDDHRSFMVNQNVPVVSCYLNPFEVAETLFENMEFSKGQKGSGNNFATWFLDKENSLSGLETEYLNNHLW